jgi:hypothetical protein
MDTSIFEKTITSMVNWIIILFCLVFIYFTISAVTIDGGTLMSTTFHTFTYYYLIFFGIFTFVLGIKAILTGVDAISW